MSGFYKMRAENSKTPPAHRYTLLSMLHLCAANPARLLRAMRFLFVSMAQRAGLPNLERFGDSTGVLSDV